jgi:hypothetical protein
MESSSRYITPFNHHTTTLASMLKETLSRGEQGSGSARVSCIFRSNCAQPKDENLYSYYYKLQRRPMAKMLSRALLYGLVKEKHQAILLL